MREFSDMMWIELRKAIRSRMPLWTGLGSLFMPLGMAFLIFVSRNPEITQKLGLVGAKADLVAYAATDWPAYLSLFGMIVAVGGFFLAVLILSWVFGREFIDGTVKDFLAVPVERMKIILAKFGVAVVWAASLTLLIVLIGLITGAALGLPGGSPEVFVRGSAVVLAAGGLVTLAALPFAYFASAGRGYLLPIGMGVLAVMAANLIVVLGWGEYFPWSIPALYAQGESPLAPVSFAIVAATGLVGVAITYLWWKHADQNR